MVLFGSVVGYVGYARGTGVLWAEWDGALVGSGKV